MTINFASQVIELTSAEMKEAQKYGSELYNQVCKIRRDFPNFKVKEVKSKAKKSKNDFGDLNMKTIKVYVEKHGTEEQKANFKFISQKSINEDGEYVEAQSFFEIKKWFLNEFPELKQARKEYREKVQKIYEAAEAKAEAVA